jgi:hypothetical protein
MKKRLLLAVGVAAALLVISTAGYSWNYATHAYIAGKIGTYMPILKMNQVYGIMAPDIFNLEFSLAGDNVLRGYMHGIPAQDPIGPNYDFMAVWWNAHGPFQKADAAGFLAHNDAWGADYIAHWQALSTLPAFPAGYENEQPGYIIWLAIQLDQYLEAAGVWEGLAAPPYNVALSLDERMLFTENIIEYAGDILVMRDDPEIGQKIMDAAMVRTPSFWALLMRALPHSYQPLMKAAEEAFQQSMLQYGALLQTNEVMVLAVVSQQMAEFAVQYLAFKTGVPASDLSPIYMPVLLPISTLAMNEAVHICEISNFMQEVNDTADYVAGQLQAHDISSKLLR